MEGVALELKADAFDSLTVHLQRNASVQNMAIMTTAGFCRNCLAKWLFTGAQRRGLDMTFDDACIAVYGMPYEEWKASFQRKATDEELKAFEASKYFHAQHPKDIVFKTSGIYKGSSRAAAKKRVKKPVVASDVCCEIPGSALAMASAEEVAANAASVMSFTVESTPAVRLGILTVSDRVSQGVYEDKSGPEIRQCIEAFARRTKAISLNESDIHVKVVADEKDQICAALNELSEECNLILTSGGTGLSPRDVTPEATLSVIEKEVRGIPEAIRRETAKKEPLAMLSRAVAGLTAENSLIINLPGRPKACREALALVILPALNQIVTQLHAEPIQ